MLNKKGMNTLSERRNELKYTTNKISVYDIEGRIIKEIQLPETITPIPMLIKR